jgi:hypothetical protein
MSGYVRVCWITSEPRRPCWAAFHRKYPTLIRRLAAVTVPALLAAPLLVSLPGAAAAAPDPGGAPVVNWALAGQASADSTASGSPASNAIDGDAGTDWCTSAWTGSLTLVNSQGVALPSVGIFQNPAAVCQSYDPWDVPCVVGG